MEKFLKFLNVHPAPRVLSFKNANFRPKHAGKKRLEALGASWQRLKGIEHSVGNSQGILEYPCLLKGYWRTSENATMEYWRPSGLMS